MGNRTKKMKRHVRRAEGYIRDHRGQHRNTVNPRGAGIVITPDGREKHF